MKRFKKAFFLLTLIFFSTMLFSCGDKGFNLEIDENMTTNLIELSNIKKDTKITLTISVPEGKAIDYLLFNEQKLALSSNVYVFYITEDVTAKVFFKDDVAPTYYSLTLPDNVSADVTDLNEIVKDTLVTLTVSVPKKRLLDKVLVNEQEVQMEVDNSYSFSLTQNTVVKVYYIFEDNWKRASLYQTLTFGSLIATMEFIKEGHLEANIEMIENGNLNELSMLLNIDENKAIKEAIGSVNYVHEETNPLINIYYDSLYSYVEYTENDEVTRFSYLSDLLFLRINNLDDFIGEEGNSLTDLEFISTIISELTTILLSNMNNDYLNDNIFLLKKLTRYKFLVIADKETLLNLNGLEEYHELLNRLPEFEIVLEVYFKNLDLTHLDFEIKISDESITEIKGHLSYTDKTITKPTDLDEYPLIESASYQYNLYVDEATMLEVEVASYLIDELVKHIDFSDSTLLEQFNISGLYLDETFLIPLTAEALKVNNTSIYIKWKEGVI